MFQELEKQLLGPDAKQFRGTGVFSRCPSHFTNSASRILDLRLADDKIGESINLFPSSGSAKIHVPGVDTVLHLRVRIHHARSTDR